MRNRLEERVSVGLGRPAGVFIEFDPPTISRMNRMWFDRTRAERAALMARERAHVFWIEGDDRGPSGALARAVMAGDKGAFAVLVLDRVPELGLDFTDTKSLYRRRAWKRVVELARLVALGGGDPEDRLGKVVPKY